MEVKEIPLGKIDPGSRARENYSGLIELAESIRNNGLIQNIAVFDKRTADNWDKHHLKSEETNSEAPYLLLAGGRRLRAFIEGSIAPEIPAKIYNQHLDANDIKTIELEENIQREDLSPQEQLKLTYEIHRHYEKIHGKVEGSGTVKTGHSLRDTARKLGRSPASVSEDIALAKALITVPQLFKESKTKSDIKKAYKKAVKTIQDEEKAQKIREERAVTSKEKTQKKISQRYILSDITEGMGRIESGSIGLVELDPPLKIGFEDIYEDDLSYDNTLDNSNYLQEMRKVLTESYRIMKNNSWIIVWYPIEPWHHPLWQLMLEVGFKVRAIPLIWDKQQGQTRSPNYNLGNSYEVALYGRKGEPLLNKPGYSNIFHYKKPIQSKRTHRTEKPIELYMDIFNVFCRPGTIICSGYAGSGNTILAAENVSMSAIGFDTNPDLKNSFDLRVFDNFPPNYSSY